MRSTENLNRAKIGILLKLLSDKHVSEFSLLELSG
jgi:hypothetical protein